MTEAHDTHVGYRVFSSMTKIFDRVYLGCFKNAEDLPTFNPHGITCVLNCTKEPLNLPRAVNPRDTTGFEVFQMNQDDGEEWNAIMVHTALGWLRDKVAGGKTVLVHCHAGKSRSPVMVAAYLHSCGIDFCHSLDLIKELRPQVQPAPAILISMKHILGLSPIQLPPFAKS